MMWADVYEDEVYGYMYVCKHDTDLLHSVEVKYDVLYWQQL